MSSQSIIAASPIQELILSVAGAEQGRGCHAGGLRTVRRLMALQGLRKEVRFAREDCAAGERDAG